MFISHESYLVDLPRFLGPRRTAWRMMELESIDPWYYLTVRFNEGTEHRTKKMMPTDVSMLSELLGLQDPTFLVEDIQVVTSPRLNGGSSDRMEKLVTLVIGYDHNGQCVLLHEVASGAIYSSARNSPDAGSLTNIRTIYEDAKIAHPPAQACAEH